MREYVRQHMKQNGITQETLAKKLGITQGAVSQVLGGRGAVPKSFTDLLDAVGLELVLRPKGRGE